MTDDRTVRQMKEERIRTIAAVIGSLEKHRDQIELEIIKLRSESTRLKNHVEFLKAYGE